MPMSVVMTTGRGPAASTEADGTGDGVTVALVAQAAATSATAARAVR